MTQDREKQKTEDRKGVREITKDERERGNFSNQTSFKSTV